MPLASGLSPFSFRTSAFSRSRPRVGVANGPFDNPAAVPVMCANGRESEKKSGSQFLSEERRDDRGISQW